MDGFLRQLNHNILGKWLKKILFTVYFLENSHLPQLREY